MFRRFIIPTIFTFVAFATLITLGTWQIERLNYKNAMVESVNERIKLPPISLPSMIDDVEKFRHRKIKLEGIFLHDKEIHLFTGPKVMKGKPGYNILTPFKLDNGETVLVDRGWVISTKKEAETRPETLIGGHVSLTGMIHRGETPGYFTPDNDTVKNLWFWIDIATISSSSGIKLQNLYVRALKKKDATKNDVPIAGEATIALRNDHLQYAITWYSLAIILLVIYFIYIKKEVRNRDGKLQNPRESI